MGCRPLDFTTVESLLPLVNFVCRLFCVACFIMPGNIHINFAEDVQMFWVFYWYLRLDVYTLQNQWLQICVDT